MNIIKQVSGELNIKESSVKATLSLLEEGATIPFIARYRKEQTGALTEDEIRNINQYYTYEVNLLKRKEDVIRLIEEKDLLTEDLKSQILISRKLVEVEDLYRPFKEKKKTKASKAINLGLEPLAKKIMSFPTEGNLDFLVTPYVNEEVTKEYAKEGAMHIISEYISDNAFYRKWIRNNIYHTGKIVTKKKKNDLDEKSTFEMYYDYNEEIKRIKPHRVLAINRAEKLDVLSVNFDINKDDIINFLNEKIIKNEKSFVVDLVKEAILDSLKRLIVPSIIREIRTELTENADENAIDNFSKNLEKLLMQPPMKDKKVLGFDPAFRTGCKLAVLDITGKKLDIAVIYPHEPVKEIEKSKKIVLDLINKYDIDIIAIGNGTASRESETFIANLLKETNHKCQYIIVSEAGASVYSASPLAKEEFPDLTVEKRSAISIGRRLQDPLSELVKIDPESIGVGLYQHDVSNKKLTESLNFVVSKAVNSVGVNINTSSVSLLKYVAGLNKTSIKKIIDYRECKGKILSREEIKKILTPKAYEQSVGFLRIPGATNKLDETSIHPESYKYALDILKLLNMDYSNIGTKELVEKLDTINLDNIDIDKYTKEDIIKSLKLPSRDPRDDMPKPLLKSDVLDIKDLKLGMSLEGTVRNVVDFGAFIDIGLHNDGLAHISKLTDKYIKHPSEILSVGDIITCYVDDINIEKEKVSLSLIKR